MKIFSRKWKAQQLLVSPLFVDLLSVPFRTRIRTHEVTASSTLRILPRSLGLYFLPLQASWFPPLYLLSILPYERTHYCVLIITGAPVSLVTQLEWSISVYVCQRLRHLVRLKSPTLPASQHVDVAHCVEVPSCITGRLSASLQRLLCAFHLNLTGSLWVSLIWNNCFLIYTTWMFVLCLRVLRETEHTHSHVVHGQHGESIKLPMLSVSRHGRHLRLFNAY